MDWAHGAGSLSTVVTDQTEACLAVYREDPSRVEQDANNELRIAEGGYRNRQLYELIQNATDAARVGGGRIEVHLNADTLYVANDGEPFTAAGVRALMASDLSPKSDDRIGRFGIGFKSVLSVSSAPRVYSRSVSFGFDADWAEEVIRGAGFGSPRYPAMRIAKVLDADAAAGGDARLNDLMSWATTVIVLPIREQRNSLAADVRSFPAEFLLFSSHLRSVRVVDTETPAGERGRLLTCVSRHGSDVVVSDGRANASWVVVGRSWQPTTSALRDAGRIAGRESVRLEWAVPRRPGPGLGVFWSHFPTQALTTLSGIVNAPWRLSDDRLNPLEGEFNQILLAEVLPALVADNVGFLYDPREPGRILDIYPARGNEPRSWADRVINEPIYERLRHVPSLADCAGTLREPSRLTLLPGSLKQAWIDEWVASGLAPLAEWAHWDTGSTTERRAKARRLVGRSDESPEAITGWLEALTSSKSVDASEAALLLAARVLREAPDQATADAATRARVLKLEDGSFVRPLRGKVFVRATADDPNSMFVDGDLAERPGVTEALAVFGVTLRDRHGELQDLLVNHSHTDAEWDRIWRLSRELPQDVCLDLFRRELRSPHEREVRVRTAAATWKPLSTCLLAGTIIPADRSRDRELLIDPHYHAEDLELLRELGAVSEPMLRDNAPGELWRGPYEQAMKDHFLAKLTASRPSPDHLVVTGPRALWPLDVLERLSPEGRVAMTLAILGRSNIEAWRVAHTSNKSYGTATVVSPEVWLLRKHGMVPTPFGPLKPSRAILAAPEGSEQSVPIVNGISTRSARKLGVREGVEELTRTDWEHLKSIADNWEDDRRRIDFYTYLPARLEPDQLIVRVGPRLQKVQKKHIGVTSSEATFDALIEARVPAMLVPDSADADRFRDAWGMPDGKDLLRQEIDATESGEPTYLLDDFPPLKLNPALSLDDHRLQLQHCTRLVRLVATPEGQVARSIPVHRDGTRLLVTARNPSEVLDQVSRALKLGLSENDIRRVLDQVERSRQSGHRRRVKRAAQESPEAGLVAAIGVPDLRAQVPRQALDALTASGQELADQDIARLVLSVHGVGVLKAFRSALEAAGLEPPREFAGRQRERRWVAELGFPSEWAGFPARPSPAREVVDGPVALKPLHTYQVQVTERIRALLAGIGRERGMVSLPTGAGKTRVTVQALVEEIEAGRLGGPIVWIAQSEELCEQAVESWAYVWRAAGPGAPLVISRFWGPNEVEEEPGGVQLVIATDAKLDAVIDRKGSDYDWLRTPSVVIVDEAHTSLAPRYTRILEWLDRSGRTRSGNYLIGLTATPFRGNSDTETERLAKRYDSNLLDQGVLGGNPYRELQRMGVLANVERRTLDGVAVEFTESDIAEIESLGRFPGRTAEQLGNDIERNETIVRSILELPDDWQVLLFAPSVENARAIAALLSHRGTPAVSISSGTDTYARRHYIEQFRRKEIRVMTNYQVLTQGFDAPAVRAVYVSRPTFSPNLYQQMVGRGLRGPKNGGSEEVLIVDVEDNLNLYGDRLAFREFERLWTS